MRVVGDVLTGLEQVPADRLVLILGLAAIALAAFAIHTISQIAKGHGRRS